MSNERKERKKETMNFKTEYLGTKYFSENNKRTGPLNFHKDFTEK